MSSAICFNLDQFKILSSGEGFSTLDSTKLAFSQAKDTNSTLFVMYPWPLASLTVETPAVPPMEYHESRNLC